MPMLVFMGMAMLVRMFVAMRMAIAMIVMMFIVVVMIVRMDEFISGGIHVDMLAGL
jgi:hypothetical protein